MKKRTSSVLKSKRSQTEFYTASLVVTVLLPYVRLTVSQLWADCYTFNPLQLQEVIINAFFAAHG